MLTLLIDLLLILSLAFTALTLLGLHEPRLGLVRSRRDALRRNGLIALACFALMAIALSVKVIDQRGYDARYASIHPTACTATARPLRAV
ncbi:hypothetical protein [Acidihalobacter ferrooxydans]|uniref:Uncharacterized protein n=1 Tax=Acidihalobacter ferrooxydans TaxID=1765967 RepID=A0A1P8UG90_9GAMM|nr:hypothetical protein [Acidihalobacter ferrooxydans]APZ42867.1 hypothetical protein BW247_06975 [Acidihalobacter ferrooxydans]